MLSLCKEPLLEKPIVYSCLKSLYWLDLCWGCSTHCLPLIVTLFTVQRSYKKKKVTRFASPGEKKRQYVFAHTYGFYNILLNTVWPQASDRDSLTVGNRHWDPTSAPGREHLDLICGSEQTPRCWEIFIPLLYWLTSPELVPPHTSQHHMSSKWVVIWNP